MFNFARKRVSESIYENMSNLDVTDDIKDEFLDDPDAMTIGAENDPEIDKLIDKIPPDDDADEPTEDDIDKITESLFDYSGEDDKLIKDRITDEDDAAYTDPSFINLSEDYDSESDSAIRDRITGEGCKESDDDAYADPSLSGIDEDYESESDDAIKDRITDECDSAYIF